MQLSTELKVQFDVDHGVVVPVEVRLDDLDAGAVVYNARYATLAEAAIFRLWAQHGAIYRDGRFEGPDATHMVREFWIEYLAPITGTGEIAVHLWVERLGTTSVVYGFKIYTSDGGVLYARGRRAMVNVHPSTRRPYPWSEQFREWSQPLVREELPG
ncbi:acyl-CoA thioesterase [Pseudonocardiaceae bacterium YIM PH 21723]|nr:acyl-CoA thioesterase [Pseudonocardiaceae bacterium YIM PH 21723]